MPWFAFKQFSVFGLFALNFQIPFKRCNIYSLNLMKLILYSPYPSTSNIGLKHNQSWLLRPPTRTITCNPTSLHRLNSFLPPANDSYIICEHSEPFFKTVNRIKSLNEKSRPDSKILRNSFLTSSRAKADHCIIHFSMHLYMFLSINLPKL